jgi:hypothetical protein
MKPVQAVEVGQPITLPAKQTAQHEEAQRLSPHVVGGKIIDPRIDQEDMGAIGRHDRPVSVSVEK